MTKAELDELWGVLQRINTTAQELEVLRHLRESFGIKVEGLLTFELTPEKPYLARANSMAMIRNQEVSIVTLAMNEGDGTGDANSYPEGSLTLPQRYKSLGTRAYPRKKVDPLEWAIPLFSFNPLVSNRVKPFHSSLVELGIEDSQNRVIEIATMKPWVESGINGKPQILFTLRQDSEWPDFGTSHSIVAPMGSRHIQVVSFIAAKKTSDEVYALLSDKGKMPKQRKRA